MAGSLDRCLCLYFVADLGVRQRRHVSIVTLRMMVLDSYNGRCVGVMSTIAKILDPRETTRLQGSRAPKRTSCTPVLSRRATVVLWGRWISAACSNQVSWQRLMHHCHTKTGVTSCMSIKIV